MALSQSVVSELLEAFHAGEAVDLVANGMADRTVRLWDVATRAPGRVLEGHTDQVWSVAFSPDGRRLVSAGDDRTIRQWDVASGRQPGQPVLAHEDVVWRAVYSPDGARIASASGDGTVTLWRSRTACRSAVISPRGRGPSTTWRSAQTVERSARSGTVASSGCGT